MHDEITSRVTIGYQHRVIFTHDALAETNAALRDALSPRTPTAPPRVLFILDAGLVNAQPDLPAAVDRCTRAHNIDHPGAPLIIPGGERCKNSPHHLYAIYAAVSDRGICRRSFVIAVGGGAILDLAGFAAATAHRSVRHIRIPTTTLSQADSAVGVKNGVNYLSKKNFIGAFAPPDAVIIDPAFLRTLTDRDHRAGVSEAIKVALLKDPVFFEWIESNADALAARDEAAADRLVRRSAELHLGHITTSGDPFERGASRPLDFGHWAAHRLESLSNYNITHGEAVAIGLAIDLMYSALAGLLDIAISERAIRTLELVGFETFHPLLLDNLGAVNRDLLLGLDEFREHLGGELTITLLADLGVGIEVNTMNPALIAAAISALRDRAAAAQEAAR